MICLVNEIPQIFLPRAEVIKINCAYNSYKDIAMFWTQNGDKAVISMLDGNMVIYNNGADISELQKFIDVVSPSSIFSDADTLSQLFNGNFHKVFVMKSEFEFECKTPSDIVKSDEIYRLLDVNGLELPSYEYFAVDFCHRLNHGQLKYFAIKEKCAAVAISDGQAVLVNGIASGDKGMGSLALSGLLAQCNGPSIAVCERDVMPFYLKNNFCYSYDAGYWRKSV